MARPNPIRAIMEAPLPDVAHQCARLFRPDPDTVLHAYKIINKYVFDNQLSRPKIVVAPIKKYWGYCLWYNDYQDTEAHSEIHLTDSWYCHQMFMNVLAHEMVHQYQWDVYRWDYLEQHGRKFNEKTAGHGASFRVWQPKFNEYGLTLRPSFDADLWFKHQNFSKC